MKKFLGLLFFALLISNIGFAESRFGELTEMHDERMRGKDNQWVRPHPGPLFGTKLKENKEIFLGKKQTNTLFMHKIIIKQY